MMRIIPSLASSFMIILPLAFFVAVDAATEDAIVATIIMLRLVGLVVLTAARTQDARVRRVVFLRSLRCLVMITLSIVDNWPTAIIGW